MAQEATEDVEAWAQRCQDAYIKRCAAGLDAHSVWHDSRRLRDINERVASGFLYNRKSAWLGRKLCEEFQYQWELARTIYEDAGRPGESDPTAFEAMSAVTLCRKTMTASYARTPRN